VRPYNKDEIVALTSVSFRGRSRDYSGAQSLAASESLRFWASDDALKLAKGLRAALDQTASSKS
jgi:hypothetical protein